MIVMGIDLSLAMTGLAVLPDTFASAAGLDWSGVGWGTVADDEDKPQNERERIARLIRLSSEIVDAAENSGASHCIFEEHAFSQTHQVYPRGELAGVVKYRLTQAGIIVEAKHASSARKTLLGKCPRKGGKAAAAAHCRQLEVPWTSVKVSHGYGDICDAFVMANHLLAELGRPFAGMPEPT